MALHLMSLFRGAVPQATTFCSTRWCKNCPQAMLHLQVALAQHGRIRRNRGKIWERHFSLKEAHLDRKGFSDHRYRLFSIFFQLKLDELDQHEQKNIAWL